ncbi:MAG: proline racemase family protein [Pirellulaceae bacterium]
MSATLIGENQVAIENVPSYRQAKDVRLTIDGLGEVVGDVAWGGNWFFLTKSISIPLEMSSIDALTDAAWRIRQAVNAHGFPDVDHVELFGAPRIPRRTPRASSCVPARRTIGRPAAPVPRPSSPA